MTNTSHAQTSGGSMPLWFWIAAVLGLAWNIFGLVQFVGSLSATPESLQAQGLSPEQADVMLGYPAWMTLAFAIGVLGGVVGCVLLILRRSAAMPVFAVSLAGYLALFAGDIMHGVFEAMGTPQVVVLSIVVLIAAALLWLALRFRKAGLLG